MAGIFITGHRGMVGSAILRAYQKAGGDARGRMYTETAANGGTGFLYTLPGMGGVDFHIGWTPRGDDGSTDATEYENILSFGASMSMDSLTIAAGM
ncbi:MAG: hypothetical protein EBY48_09980, partial [Opitutae bacterium]|nr:hypothetical protein [Opitutae bacterium]